MQQLLSPRTDFDADLNKYGLKIFGLLQAGVWKVDLYKNGKHVIDTKCTWPAVWGGKAIGVRGEFLVPKDAPLGYTPDSILQGCYIDSAKKWCVTQPNSKGGYSWLEWTSIQGKKVYGHDHVVAEDGAAPEDISLEGTFSDYDNFVIIGRTPTTEYKHVWKRLSYDWVPEAEQYEVVDSIIPPQSDRKDWQADRKKFGLRIFGLLWGGIWNMKFFRGDKEVLDTNCSWPMPWGTWLCGTIGESLIPEDQNMQYEGDSLNMAFYMSDEGCWCSPAAYANGGYSILKYTTMDGDKITAIEAVQKSEGAPVIYELFDCTIPDYDHFDYHITSLHGSARIVGKRVSYVTATPASKIAYKGKNVIAYKGKK